MTERVPVAAFVVALWFSPASLAQEDAHTLVERANGLFADGDYAAALEAYREAGVLQPESPELAYNEGLAYYKLQDFTAAGDAFNRALLTRDLGLEAKIKYNLGDVAYASALEKESDLQEAIDLAKKAIGLYRDALELDAEDDDAKANIETAQLLIKDLLDKLKKQQEEQEQQQDQDQDQQQNQDQQSDQQQDQQSGEDEQEKQEGEQEKEEQEGGEKQEQQPEGGDPSDQEQQEEQQEQEQQPQEGDEMTRDEAERVLQAVRDRERERRDERAKRHRVRRVPVLKDW